MKLELTQPVDIGIVNIYIPKCKVSVPIHFMEPF